MKPAMAMKAIDSSISEFQPFATADFQFKQQQFCSELLGVTAGDVSAVESAARASQSEHYFYKQFSVAHTTCRGLS